MQAQQINVDTIANNIANVNTTGFKQGRAEFQDLLYQNIRPAGTASSSLCTKNTSWALIERPYSCAPQAVGAVYDRPGFFVQSPSSSSTEYPVGLRLGLGTRPVATDRILRQGDFRQTGNPLDLVIDVTVSSIGDATSLQGGILLQTPLIGPDGIVYTLAQGSLVIRGFAAGNASMGVTVNHPTVGRIPNGANVERAVAAGMPQTIDVLEIELDRADSTPIKRATDALNTTFGGPIATPIDGRSIRLQVPPDYRQRPIDLQAELEIL